MEATIIYLLKANLLIIIYYLAYYFLVQKETFFNSNRWFLLLGLFSSITIPLFFFTKKVNIITPKYPATRLTTATETQTSISSHLSQELDWNLLIFYLYGLISIVLITKMVFSIISFFKLIKNKKKILNHPYSLVDINENINPFSFFKYIVFNSVKYTNTELENILNHEKVHSREKHSLDVLIAKLFCSLFWFNPFVWWYKKAIIQNLEYIADQKAIQNSTDKKAYQMTLLKVVTDHNYSSVTSSFYQSLIKKRIVMLNKNQSKQKNAWKYAIIIPVLIAFVVLFQIKVVAQEKVTQLNDGAQVSADTKQVAEMVWTKDTPDDEIKNDIKWMKKEGLQIIYSNLKRNSKGEIIAIEIKFKDKSGKTGDLIYSGNKPIKPIVLRREIDINNKTSISLHQLSKLNQELITPIAPIAPLAPTDLDDLPAPPDFPDFPTPPSVPVPANPNDEKAWKNYEYQMKKYEQVMKVKEAEMKKYEAQLALFDKEMETRDKKMEGYENEMKSYDNQMEEYQKKIEEYYEKIAQYREMETNSKEIIKRK